MDSCPGTSSHHNSSKKRESNNNNGISNCDSRYHRRKHSHHRASKSRSRSSSAEFKPKRAYINPSPKFNFFNWDKTHVCTPSEYEVKIQALSTQLTMAQSQITGLESQIHSHRNRSAQLEHQLYAAQQENLNLVGRNAEILSVMKTLETGVESLQKEKMAVRSENDELKSKLSEHEKERAATADQLAYLDKRNATLSKKCVEILESGKANKERLEKCEAELISLKPHTETLESKLKELEEQHRSAVNRISIFEARERLWISEKLAMEQRIKDLLAAEKRTQEEMRQLRLKAAAAAALQNTANENSTDLNVSGVEAEHLRALSSVVESLHAHHQTEMNRTRLKLEALANSRLSL